MRKQGAALSVPTIQRRLIESVIIMAAYCLTAYVVVHVQAGMGGANLLWLPAGIALAAVLLRGTVTLPAIFLATAGFHFYAFFSASGSMLQAIAATLIAATGSTLQAWATAWLLRRWIRNLQITTVPDALRFILCTAMGCTIAASIGTAALVSQSKLMGDEAISLSWLTWWVGDLSGMLVVAPLALVAHHWQRGKREWSLLSLPIIGLGCSFTLVSAFIVKHLDHNARVSEFLSSGVAMGQALQRTIELSQRDLMSVHAFFYNIEVSRDEFHNFASALLSQNPLIRSITWAPRVGHTQRAQFEAEVRRSGIQGFHIHDLLEDGTHVAAAVSPEYMPVLMIEPEMNSSAALGFNLMSDPLRRDAVSLARFTGEPRASRLVKLLRGGNAVITYWPVYRNEYQHEGSARDGDALRGFVSMSLEITRLAGETLRPFEGREAETWLIDVTNPDAPELLHHHVDGRAGIPPQSKAPDVEHLRQGLYQETGHSFAGREWLLISRPLSLESNLKANGQFLGILAGGLGFTFMLAMYIIGRQRSEHVLHARDERLMSQNAVLTHLARFGLDADSDVNKQLRELIATSAGTLKVERVSIWMLDEDLRQLRCLMIFTLSTGEFSDGPVLDAKDAPFYFDTLYEGRGFAAGNAQTDPRTREFADSYLKPLGITSMMDVPVRVVGKPGGVVCHEHIGPERTWAPDEQNFAASIGDLVSLVIESDMRRSVEKALQESYQELEVKVQQRTEELRRANDRLRQLDQLKSMFIASMSHELRTPLNSIIGFTGVVLQGISGPLSDKQTDHLNRVYGSARHLLDLITDVIDISKIEAGYADVYLETFSLNQLIEEAAATVQPQRAEKGLELEIDASGSIMLTSDRKRLLQCVLNLLSNAVKYSEQGTIHIRLKDEADRAVIEVEDKGIGISPEALSKLFQPFERIDTHLRVKTPGTGLGLYLTRKIMTNLLRGDAIASSIEGKGSIFTLWLPHTLPLSQADKTQT
jgi:signal transduction histidine kinase/CHASE1-domain containing sensor protein